MHKSKILEYICQTASSEPEYLIPVNGGLSATEKYKAKLNGQEWMVKLTTGNQRRNMWYQELGKRTNEQMATPKMHKLFEDGILCLISPWIVGENLESKLMYAMPSQVRDYGIQAAHILLNLHKKSFEYSEYRKMLLNRINNACNQVSRLGLTFPGYKECCDFLKKTADTCTINHVCFVHKDIRPENFIVQGENLYLIDFDNGSLGERVTDFSYLTTLGRSEHYLFSQAVIETYLETEDSNDFWQKNLLYSILQVVEYAIWKYKTKGKQVYYQAENLIQQYDNFKDIKPYWLKKLYEGEI